MTAQYPPVYAHWFMEGVYPSPQALIRAVRDQAGVTQKEAAAKVGVHWRTWQNWEKGDVNERALSQIEEAFDLPPNWFAAQLDVLGRMLALETQLARLERIGEENRELLRDVLGAIRILGSG